MPLPRDPIYVQSKLRLCLLIWNTIFVTLSCIAILIGSFALIWVQRYADVVQPVDVLEGVSISLIAVGSASTVIYILLGYSAAWRKDGEKLNAFSIALVLIGIAMFTTGCAAFTIEKSIKTTHDLHGIAIKRPSGEIKCCNVVLTTSTLKKIQEDRQQMNPKALRTNKTDEENWIPGFQSDDAVPASCCTLPHTSLYPQTELSTCSNFNEIGTVYEKACDYAFKKFGGHHMHAIGALGITAGLLQLVALAFARMLARRVLVQNTEKTVVHEELLDNLARNPVDAVVQKLL